jgi:hypothetical protein
LTPGGIGYPTVLFTPTHGVKEISFVLDAQARCTSTLPFFPSLYLQYITLHCITLHYIALHYITLHYITLHYITLPNKKAVRNVIAHWAAGRAFKGKSKIEYSMDFLSNWRHRTKDAKLNTVYLLAMGCKPQLFGRWYQ